MTQQLTTVRRVPEPEAEAATMVANSESPREASAVVASAVEAPGKKREAAKVRDDGQASASSKKQKRNSDVKREGDVANGHKSNGTKAEADSDVIMISDSEEEEAEKEEDSEQTESEDERNAEPSEPSTEISESHAEFLTTLKAGVEVDVYCVLNKMWLPAKVENVEETKFRIHFMGWNKKTDEDILATSAFRIAPRGAEAKEGWRLIDEKNEKHRIAREKKLQARIALYTNGQPVEPAPAATAMGIEEVPEVAFVEAGATRSGRRITKRIVHEGATIVRKKPTAAAPPKKSAEDHARETQEDNLCGACGEYEDEALTDMVMCDGGCLNSYHFSCIGIDEVPEEEEWLCEQCRTNEQQCFQCGRNGTIGEKGGVFRCSVASCGKFYHQNCVDTTNKHFRRQGRAKLAKETEGGDDDESNEPEGSFRCPRHVCAVCENTKKAELMTCLKCPEAYHPHCVPPSARYNNLGLLCYRHPSDKLPRIPAQYLLDRNFDSVVVDSNLRLPALFLPKNEPAEVDIDDCHHFRLQLSLMDQVKKEPPTYRKLVRSIYTFKQPKESLEDVPMCVCKKSCDDNCINRLSFTECFGPAATPGMMPLKGSERKEKESNCPLGEECGNRSLHQRLYPKFEQFHTPDKGWALRVTEPVKAGSLVIEYVGEVINEEEKDRRLNEHARLHPDDKNMYIMELSKGVYIDARHKGSVSRLINHSCDPNCRLLKWNVRGVNRIAITAVKDIAAGEELSYDYQFHTSQALEWRCYCKSKNCRGTMAPDRLNQPGADEESSKKLTKKELAKKMKRAMLQDKINQKKDEKETARRLSFTVPNGRTIGRTGPVPRELAWAKANRVFLPRNAKKGFDFLERRSLMDDRIQLNISKHPKDKNVKAEDSASPATTDEEVASVPQPAMRLKVVSRDAHKLTNGAVKDASTAKDEPMDA